MAPKLRLPPCRASPLVPLVSRFERSPLVSAGGWQRCPPAPCRRPPPSPQSLLPSMGKDYQKRKLARDFKTPAPDVWKKPRGGGAGNEGGEEEPKQGNGFNKFDLSSDAFTTYYQVLENLIIIVRATPQCRPAPVTTTGSRHMPGELGCAHVQPADAASGNFPHQRQARSRERSVDEPPGFVMHFFTIVLFVFLHQREPPI